MSGDYPQSVKDMSLMLQQAAIDRDSTPSDTPPRDLGHSAKMEGGVASMPEGVVSSEGGGDQFVDESTQSGPVSLSQILERSVYSASQSEHEDCIAGQGANTSMPGTTMGNGTSGHPASHRGHNKPMAEPGVTRTITFPEDYDYLKKLVPELKGEIRTRDQKVDQLISETLELRRQLKKKTEQCTKAQREIHKLKV